MTNNSEAIRDVFDLAETYFTEYPNWSKSLFKSIKFQMGDYGEAPKFSNMDEVIPYMENCPAILNLPYDNCTFVFSGFAILHAEKSDDGFVKTRFYLIEQDGFLENPIVGVSDFVNGRFTFEWLPNNEHRTQQQGMENLAWHICWLASCMAIINSLNVSAVAHTDRATSLRSIGSKINKKDLVYYTLHINPTAPRSKRPVSGNVQHKHSPGVRLHLRRGHLRRIKNKVIWVQPAVVGQADFGQVDKDYKV